MTRFVIGFVFGVGAVVTLLLLADLIERLL